MEGEFEPCRRVLHVDNAARNEAERDREPNSAVQAPNNTIVLEKIDVNEL